MNPNEDEGMLRPTFLLFFLAYSGVYAHQAHGGTLAYTIATFVQEFPFRTCDGNFCEVVLPDAQNGKHYTLRYHFGESPLNVGELEVYERGERTTLIYSTAGLTDFVLSGELVIEGEIIEVFEKNQREHQGRWQIIMNGGLERIRELIKNTYYAEKARDGPFNILPRLHVSDVARPTP